MAKISYAEAMEKEAADLLAIITSGTNPDGTAFSLGVGGEVTVADGADVAEGAVADAVVAAGAAGSISAKLRRLTTDLATLFAKFPGHQHDTDLSASISTIGINISNGGSGGMFAARSGGRDGEASYHLMGVVPQLITSLGVGSADAQRSINTVKNVADASITAGTPALAWTPAGGKKPRVMACELSLAVAGQIILKAGASAGASVEFWRSPKLAAGGVWSPPVLYNGPAAPAADAKIYIDVSVTGNVGGWIGGCED
jgi:hypothetical protein